MVWEIISNAVKKAVTKSIGELKRSWNTWYNDVFRIAVDKRSKPRDDFIKNNNKEVFIRNGKIAKAPFKVKKLKFLVIYYKLERMTIYNVQLETILNSSIWN